MNAVAHRNVWSRGFTLIELIAVIVVLAILSGVAIPKYFDYSSNAKASATKGVLGGVRSGIANFYANSAVSGTAAYPTLVELQTTGTVMQEPLPANPYLSGADASVATVIVAGTWASTPPVETVGSKTGGWRYDASAGRFWANSSGSSENTW
ncbi:MAG: type II secretion system protein [Phycisphaerales bacterium]